MFCLIGIVETAVAFSRQVYLYLGCARASKVLHDDLLLHVMRSPMSFFDTTPIGRIVNRFSSDLDLADETLPKEITDFLWCLVEMVSTVVLISYATPIFIAVIVGLIVVFSLIVVYYIGSSRQLKRLESISKVRFTNSAFFYFLLN